MRWISVYDVRVFCVFAFMCCDAVSSTSGSALAYALNVWRETPNLTLDKLQNVMVDVWAIAL